MSRNYRIYNIEGFYFVSFAVEETGLAIRKEFLRNAMQSRTSGGRYSGRTDHTDTCEPPPPLPRDCIAWSSKL